MGLMINIFYLYFIEGWNINRIFKVLINIGCIVNMLVLGNKLYLLLCLLLILMDIEEYEEEWVFYNINNINKRKLVCLFMFYFCLLSGYILLVKLISYWLSWF